DSGAVGDANPSPTEKNSVVSLIFPVKKKEGRIRTVINLKTINPYVQPITFTMEGIRTVKELLQPRDFMVKIDLADAFHHIPLHREHQRFFRFVWDGRLLQWRVLP